MGQSSEEGNTWYAWASPCSGSCSRAERKMGWRTCTVAEFNNRPLTKADFGNKCAATCFDPKYNHCDWGDKHVREDDACSPDTILCHDGQACETDTILCNHGLACETERWLLQLVSWLVEVYYASVRCAVALVNNIR